MVTHMKTTLDLDDAVLREAKIVAARRNTTLKDLVTRSLRREIGMDADVSLAPESPFETGPLGLPVLKAGAVGFTTERVRKLLHDGEEEDARRAQEVGRNAAK